MLIMIGIIISIGGVLLTISDALSYYGSTADLTGTWLRAILLFALLMLVNTGLLALSKQVLKRRS